MNPFHQKNTSFKKEYLKTLEKLDIKFDKQYLFNWYE